MKFIKDILHSVAGFFNAWFVQPIVWPIRGFYNWLFPSVKAPVVVVDVPALEQDAAPVVETPAVQVLSSPLKVREETVGAAIEAEALNLADADGQPSVKEAESSAIAVRGVKESVDDVREKSSDPLSFGVKEETLVAAIEIEPAVFVDVPDQTSAEELARPEVCSKDLDNEVEVDAKSSEKLPQVMRAVQVVVLQAEPQKQAEVAAHVAMELGETAPVTAILDSKLEKYRQVPDDQLSKEEQENLSLVIGLEDKGKDAILVALKTEEKFSPPLGMKGSSTVDLNSCTPEEHATQAHRFAEQARYVALAYQYCKADPALRADSLSSQGYKYEHARIEKQLRAAGAKVIPLPYGKPGMAGNPMIGVIVIHMDGTATVAYRGTQNMGMDVPTDLNARFQKFHEGSVHKGFYDAYHCSSVTMLGILREHMVRAVSFTGHSMGAAIATIAAYDYAKKTGNAQGVHICAIASPRVFDDQLKRDYDEMFKNRAFNIQQNYDAVTAVAPGWMGYCHAGNKIRIKDERSVPIQLSNMHGLSGYHQPLEAGEIELPAPQSMWRTPFNMLAMAIALPVGMLQRVTAASELVKQDDDGGVETRTSMLGSMTLVDVVSPEEAYTTCPTPDLANPILINSGYLPGARPCLVAG